MPRKDQTRKIAVVLKSRQDRGRSGVLHVLQQGSDTHTICGKDFAGYKAAAVTHGVCERCETANLRKFVMGSADNPVTITQDQIEDAKVRFRVAGGVVVVLPDAHQPDRAYVPDTPSVEMI